jgi:hypothetical protein
MIQHPLLLSQSFACSIILRSLIFTKCLVTDLCNLTMNLDLLHNMYMIGINILFGRVLSPYTSLINSCEHSCLSTLFVFFERSEWQVDCRLSQRSITPWSNCCLGGTYRALRAGSHTLKCPADIKTFIKKFWEDPTAYYLLLDTLTYVKRVNV